MKITKRAFIKASAAAVATLPLSQSVFAANNSASLAADKAATLSDITTSSRPITVNERKH